MVRFWFLKNGIIRNDIVWKCYRSSFIVECKSFVHIGFMSRSSMVPVHMRVMRVMVTVLWGCWHTYGLQKHAKNQWNYFIVWPRWWCYGLERFSRERKVGCSNPKPDSFKSLKLVVTALDTAKRLALGVSVTGPRRWPL